MSGGRISALFHRNSGVQGNLSHTSLPLNMLSMSGDGTSNNSGLHSMEILPPVEVTNPVLANLELANSLDPRRHRRNDSKLSDLSLGSLRK